MESENSSAEMYVYRNNQRMRCGYTTGSCAAAAAKAATIVLISHNMVDEVNILTPKGTFLKLPILDVKITKESVSCAVMKDGGDDIDVTHGALIYAEVSKINQGIIIDGSRGVGRVTKKGLDQPIGNAAINSVPRQMISREIKEVCDACGYEGGISVTISVPDGEKLAEKTFNPRLGIVGGISIIGTSGIVEPMSQEALVETIKTEINMRVSNGEKYILAVPGNYGEDFSKTISSYPAEDMIKCSNFVGETIDGAAEFGAEGILFIANIGKFIKVAGGIMNTHSRNADARMEIIAANAALAGVERETLVKIMQSVTTEDALEILHETEFFDETMKLLTEKINFYLKNRAKDGLKIGAIIFSSVYGMLGKTEDADYLLKRLESDL